MLFVLHQLTALLIIVGSAAIFGTALLGHRVQCHPWERWLLATVLGIGVIAQGLFVLGVLGGLQPRTILGALALGHLVCWRRWRDLGRQLTSWSQELADAGSKANSATRGPLLGLPLLGLPLLGLPLFGLIVVGLPQLVLALYPPTGFDATVYHLPYVEHFLAAGRLVFVEDLRFPIFPQVAEMGFLLGFVLAGDVVAQLTQVLATLLTAGLLYYWLRLEGSRRAGLWAAALWLGVPLVMWIGSQAYVDVGLTMFVTAAWLCWDRWRLQGLGWWCALAGVFAGFAAGTKYLGLFFVAAFGVATCWRAWRQRELGSVAWYSMGALSSLGPWYLRLVHSTGNPLFPFYSQLFGSNEWVSLHDRNLAAQTVSSSGNLLEALVERMVSGLGFLLTTPWTGVFEREIFHHQAPLTPFYLLLLPLCLPLALWSSRAHRWRGLLVLGYCVFWLTTVRDLRFLLPILPPLHLILCSGLERLGRWPKMEAEASGGRRRWLAGLLAVLLLLPGWGYAWYKVIEKGTLPTDAESRRTYLATKVAGVGLLQRLNAEYGSSYTVYALFGERLNYYADGQFLGDLFGPQAFEHVLPALASGEDLFRELRLRDACFFMVRLGNRKAQLPDDAEFRLRFRSLKRSDDFELFALEDPACPNHLPAGHTNS